MSKRPRTGGSVTGGTGDIKPQIYTSTTGDPPDTDDYVTAQITLPVPRFGTMRTKATIFEILWVDWYLGMADLADTTNTYWAWLSTVQTRDSGDTSTLATSAEDARDPRTFAMAYYRSALNTNGYTTFTFPLRIDLTDRNGNGLLIATDKLQITQGNVAGTATVGAGATCKIGYRMVNVGVNEYIGIVQSQQS